MIVVDKCSLRKIIVNMQLVKDTGRSSGVSAIEGFPKSMALQVSIISWVCTLCLLIKVDLNKMANDLINRAKDTH